MPDGTTPPEVQDLRRDLAAAYRLIALEGMDDGIYTHISARLPDGPGGEKRFLLNPFGLRFDEVTAANLVTVDETGAVIDDPYGAGVNAAGFTIHSAVHMARHDAVCVLHTHTVAGVAVSSVKEGLLSLNQWSAQFHNRIAYHDYEGIALDLAERERIVADLGEKQVMLLRNHGTLLLGRSVAEAVKLALNLERSCKAQVAALGMGLTADVLPEAVAEHTASQYQRAYDGVEERGKPDPEWAAQLRRLDAHAPDYRG
ncbi:MULTISPECIES: class II aldolase/adducin family protein [Roseobacteraceae]|uniref:class II aldolase/adducin family protein n=1 Tax=Roseobacteraceae TaxID=2854170 RepID=UPI00080AA825|nr:MULTISPECIES: class II aldolase/adducin family protein [Roseobacteraceae]ANT62438.1 class II aldolase [Salipiger sp. CCB-MM3]MCA0996886.1 class II aldolase/adducin family protein [Alloyangia pacifica]NDW02169.1 class II aldolase/adducin family protein [Salipiger sp. PrR002]NDW59174.1 class II aldolase/adducin family protein [Salipiger sp. PrR004]